MFLLLILPATVLGEANKTLIAKEENKAWPTSMSAVVPFGFHAFVEGVN
jgi:hypothetical protein